MLYNLPMHTPTSATGDIESSHRSARSAAWHGLLFCFGSTTFYCTSNIILRGLTEQNVSNDWTLFYKELIGLTILMPWLVCRFFQGRYAHQSKRLLACLIVGGIVCELIGARLQLWAFGVIGIILAMPIIQALNLVSTAVLGVYLVNEKLSRRKLWVIPLLIVALSVLTWGKLHATPEATTPTAMETAQWLAILGVVAAMVTGLAYAFHMTCMRIACSAHWREEYSLWDNLRWSDWIGAGQQTPPDDTNSQQHKTGEPVSLILAMAIILVIGVLGFGFCLYREHGLNGFVDAPPVCWWLVAASGVANLIGFFCQAFALRLTSATQVMLISVLQIGVITLTGYFLFGEPVNTLIVVGLILTTLGVIASMEDLPKHVNKS
ncbi:MAG: DMT family transporter [Thermoguttaceae bacterium]